MNHSAEGVIRFDLTHTKTPALPVEDTAGLRAWFIILRQLELLGQDPGRYLGYAYGNISTRTQGGFVISCTQTSGKTALQQEDFALVTGFDTPSNRLVSEGPCPPSSEGSHDPRCRVSGATPDRGCVPCPFPHHLATGQGTGSARNRPIHRIRHAGNGRGRHHPAAEQPRRGILHGRT